VAFFALQATGRVPAMLNVSTGAAGMLSACRTANVKIVLCARRFVERGKLHAILAELERHTRVVYLDDLQAEIGGLDKALGLAKSYAPSLANWELRA